MRRVRWIGVGVAVLTVVGFATEPASAVRARRRTTVPNAAAQANRAGGAVAGTAVAAPTTAPRSNARTAAAPTSAAAMAVVVGTKQVVAVTPVASAGTLRVSALGTPNLSAVDLANQALVVHRDRLSKLQGVARSGLFADPVSSEDVVQTSDGTYFVGTTTMNVTNPSTLQANGIRNVRPEAGLTLGSLDAQQRRDFDAYKADALRRPNGDPMHDAAAQGDQALLDAIAVGKGPVVVTSSVFVPSGNLSMRDRTVQVPRLSDGEFDYTTRTAKTLSIVPPRPSAAQSAPVAGGQLGGQTANTRTLRRSGTATNRAAATPTTRPVAQGAVSKRGASVAAATSPELQSSGTDESKSHFLTGWTIDGGVTWKETWDFGFVGNVTVTAEAWYAVGLRVPVLVTGTITPSHLADTGAPGEDFTVSVSAEALDEDADFYSSTGLPNSQVYDGKEFVLEAGAHVKIKGKILGVGFNEKIPQNDSFDFGQNIRPPFGNCGTDCGVQLWVPADITHTIVRVLGIVTGSAQIGVSVSGNGDVAGKFSALDNGSVIPSRVGNGGATNVQTFHDDGKGSDPTYTSTMPGGDSRPFGYRFADPTYTWTIVVTPGVKGTIDINAKPFYQDTIPIGPLWIDAAAIRLGQLVFPTHAGTTSSRDRMPGGYSVGATKVGGQGAQVQSGNVQAITTTTSASPRAGQVAGTAPGVQIATTTTTPAVLGTRPPQPQVSTVGAPGANRNAQRRAAPAGTPATPTTKAARRRRGTAAPATTAAAAAGNGPAARRRAAARTGAGQG